MLKSMRRIAVEDRRARDAARAKQQNVVRMMKAGAAAKKGDSDPIYATKLVTAKYFVERWLPQADAHLARIESGAETMMTLEAEAF